MAIENSIADPAQPVHEPDMFTRHEPERLDEIHHATGVHGWRDRALAWLSDRPHAETAIVAAVGVALLIFLTVVAS